MAEGEGVRSDQGHVAMLAPCAPPLNRCFYGEVRCLMWQKSPIVAVAEGRAIVVEGPARQRGGERPTTQLLHSSRGYGGPRPTDRLLRPRTCRARPAIHDMSTI